MINPISCSTLPLSNLESDLLFAELKFNVFRKSLCITRQNHDLKLQWSSDNLHIVIDMLYNLVEAPYCLHDFVRRPCCHSGNHYFGKKQLNTNDFRSQLKDITLSKYCHVKSSCFAWSWNVNVSLYQYHR